MESTYTAAWEGPFELHQVATNWSAQEPADAQVWDPAVVGLPLQYASIVDIFGSSSCSLQPYDVPASISSGGQQLVEYNYYAAAAQHHDPTGIGATTTAQEDQSSFDVEKLAQELFEKKESEFNDDRDAEFMKTKKMHRYPPSIRALGDWCTVPKVVAIGPYYYRQEHLQKAETVKQVAAYHCIQYKERVHNKSGPSLQEMYQEVVSVGEKINARGLYDKDVMAGIDDNEDFLPMMFYDACFLVMYMLKMSGATGDKVLFDFFESSDDDIAHDIMLLENQIPWRVVEAVMNKCTPEPLKEKEKFIAMWKDECLQDQANKNLPTVFLHPSYDEAPHLLGLLRFHMVGSGRSSKVSESDQEKIKSISISAGAIELAEMGIHLTAKETAELPDSMRVASKWIIFAELSMAPLSLDEQRATMLVNMAALELCTTPYFHDKEKGVKLEDSAVCSYLLLLCMLMHREEDVHELRRQGILRGAGFTDKRALDVFTSLESLRKGRSYFDVMVEIERYRVTRWWGWLPLYRFVYRNWKYIVGFGSAVGGLIGFLIKLKDAHLI